MTDIIYYLVLISIGVYLGSNGYAVYDFMTNKVSFKNIVIIFIVSFIWKYVGRELLGL